MTNIEHHINSCERSKESIINATKSVDEALEALKYGTLDDETYYILKQTRKDLVDISEQIDRYEEHYNNIQ